MATGESPQEQAPLQSPLYLVSVSSFFYDSHLSDSLEVFSSCFAFQTVHSVHTIEH
jgi:hypothetical protein